MNFWKNVYGVDMSVLTPTVMKEPLVDYVNRDMIMSDSCKVLDPTPHEHAWASLKATNDHHDPECVACHVTGWGDSSGFITEASTPKLINVTCEACHGPGEEHNNLQTKTPNGKLGKQFCVKCHDPDNSPKFDFDKYWPKIQHPPKAK